MPRYYFRFLTDFPFGGVEADDADQAYDIATNMLRNDPIAVQEWLSMAELDLEGDSYQ